MRAIYQNSGQIPTDKSQWWPLPEFAGTQGRIEELDEAEGTFAFYPDSEPDMLPIKCHRSELQIIVEEWRKVQSKWGEVSFYIGIWEERK